MHDKVYILTAHLKRFWDYARLHNIPERELLAATKQPSIAFDNPASVIATSDFFAILEVISRSVKDDLLGLKIGEYHNLNTLGVIYRISMKATDLKEALFFCSAYLERTFPIIEEIQSSNDKSVTIELQGCQMPDKLKRIVLECTLVIISREIKTITGEQIELSIGSPFYQGNYPTGWKRSDAFSISFKPEALQYPIPERNRWQMEILLTEYISMIENIHVEQAFSDKGKIMALNMAKPNLPDLKSLSGAFHLTPRTFQRRLAEEGTSYSKIINELKQQIAMLLIRHQRFSITDISNILDYSEPTAFIRSFKNKYGNTPFQYRQKQNLKSIS
jgi:AraC-like DNA-binding protein